MAKVAGCAGLGQSRDREVGGGMREEGAGHQESDGLMAHARRALQGNGAVSLGSRGEQQATTHHGVPKLNESGEQGYQKYRFVG